MNTNSLNIASKTITTLLNPIAVPIYLSVILLYNNNTLLFISPLMKLLFLLLMVVFTAIIPAFLLPFLERIKIISSRQLTIKKDRFTAYTFISIYYMIIQILVVNNFDLFLIYKIFACLNILLMTTAILSCFFKLDTHSIAYGATAAIFFLLNNTGFMSFETWFLISFLCFGLAGAANIYLEKTNLGQTFISLILGFGATSFIFLM